MRPIKQARAVLPGNPSIHSFDHSSFIVSYILVNLPVAASFFLVLRLAVKVQQSDALSEYWQTEFLDFRRPWAWPLWLVRRLLLTLQLPLFAQWSGPSDRNGIGDRGALEAAGRRASVLLTGPLLAVLLAAALHRYPFDGGHLTMFLTPAVILLSALGFEHLFVDEPAGAVAATRGQVAGAAGAAFLLLVAAGRAPRHITWPSRAAVGICAPSPLT